MSNSSIPAYADTRKIFLQEGKISGTLSLDRLPRFSKSLADSEGSVSVTLNFRLNDAKERLISGNLQAAVNVYCQRCLEPLAIRLSDDIKLALVRDEEAAKRLTADLDPWICEDYKLDLAELAEEQLILCMPLVSYHDAGECLNRKNFVAGATVGNEVTAEAPDENPFAVLKSLKDSDSSD
ncbi:MAG: YceD family protein [Pseudohongiellaceae bacterium]